MEYAIIYIVGVVLIGLCLIYYASQVSKQTKTQNHLDLSLRQDFEFLKKDLKNVQEQMMRMSAGQNKNLVDLRENLTQKIEAAEFLAHSAKMDIAKGIPIRFSEPLKVYTYQRMVPPREENEKRRQAQLAKLKNQIEGLK